MPDSRKILGLEGENLACRFLEKIGYQIVCRNFSGRYGEIDIIAEHKKELHFVEVKTRRRNQFMEPEEAVDGYKQEKLRKMAQVFLSLAQSRRFCEHDIYLDVIAITCGEKPQIKHLVGAF